MVGLRAAAEGEARRMEGKPKATCEFNSSSELTLCLKKNAAMKRELQVFIIYIGVFSVFSQYNCVYYCVY
jgi:hypothetical protein